MVLGISKYEEELELSDKQSIRGYLRGYDKEVLLIRRIFTNTNKDGSIGILVVKSHLMETKSQQSMKNDGNY